MMSVLDHAIALGRQGLPVFPCGRTKRPTCPDGFYAAVVQEADIVALWRAHPGPLVGVPTGKVSGFDVLDIDPRHGGDRWWLEQEHRIPATKMHRTGSNGLHVLFQHAEGVRNSESKIAPGVDTRGCGGYCIWWPGNGLRVVEVPLVPWPKWLLRKLLAKPKPAQSAATNHGPITGTDAAKRIAERVLDRLKQAPDGERHYRLRKAAYTIGGLLEHLSMSASEAEKRLVDAVMSAGAVDKANAERTAAWGVGRGKASPLKMEAR